MVYGGYLAGACQCRHMGGAGRRLSCRTQRRRLSLLDPGHVDRPPIQHSELHARTHNRAASTLLLMPQKERSGELVDKTLVRSMTMMLMDLGPQGALIFLQLCLASLQRGVWARVLHLQDLMSPMLRLAEMHENACRAPGTFSPAHNCFALLPQSTWTTLRRPSWSAPRSFTRPRRPSSSPAATAPRTCSTRSGGLQRRWTGERGKKGLGNERSPFGRVGDF